KDGDAVRYEDRYDLECLRTSAVTYTALRPDAGVPVAVGSEPLLVANFVAIDKAGTPVAAFGHGFALGEPDASVKILAEDESPLGMELALTAVRPGGGPTITA